MKTNSPPLENAATPIKNDTNSSSAIDPNVGDLIESRHIIHFPPTATVRQACKMMTMLNMGALPVVSDDKLMGIFTERDIVSKVMATDKGPDDILLSEVMTEQVISIGPSTKISRARRIMLDKGFRHLPVVARGQVLGIVSIRDLID